MALDADRKREVVFGAGVLGLVILFALAGEAFFRLRDGIHVDWDGMRQTIMVEEDGNGLTRFIPGTAFANIEVDPLGFTSPQVAVPKPEDTLRLLFLGDSVVLGAALKQADRLAGKVTPVLGAALSGCKMDYVTIAGPSYRLSDLATLLGESRSQIDPDGVVLMIGGIRDIFLSMEEQGGPFTGLAQEPGWLERRSVLFDRWQTFYARADIARRPPSDTPFGPIDPDEFSRTYLEMIDRLAATIGDVPVVVVENRGRDRADDTDADLGLAELAVATHLDGMNGAGIRHLEDLQKSTLQRAAALHGWAYVDPLADLPPTDTYFRDPMHLTAEGVSAIAPVIAERLLDRLQAQGTVAGCLPPSD